MKIGIMHMATRGRAASVDGLVYHAQDFEKRGFSSIWVPNVFGMDAITGLAIAGHETSAIELGTAVVPVHPRHPFVMAQQALTAGAASGGRFTLGIGLSHKLVIEEMFGLSYERPARRMREYLEVLAPLLRGEPADWDGELYRSRGGLDVPDAKPVPVVLAALGPALLRIAGRLADGTLTWMVGAKTLEAHIVPTLRAAAEEAGRPAPRVIAGVPMAVVRDVDAAREKAGQILQMYGSLPSYRAMLDREGAEPADLVILGDEAVLRVEIERLRDLGVTDLAASVLPVEDGSRERTTDLLAGLT